MLYAQQEARSITEFFPQRQQMVLLGPLATESSFKRLADRYQVLHLATHGYFNQLNPLFSGVQLEADQDDDGRLEVHEILGLRLHASLVTLSACETALGSAGLAKIIFSARSASARARTFQMVVSMPRSSSGERITFPFRPANVCGA